MKLIYDFDKSIKFCKNFDEEEYLKDSNVQIKFDLDIDNRSYDEFICGECHTIYYNKNNNKVFKKITRTRPIDSEKNRIGIGYVNAYNHQVLNTYQQYRFKI